MALSPDTDQQVIETVQRFARETLAPAAAQMHASGNSATQHRAALAELGLFGLNCAEEHGGAGLDGETLSACVEAVAGACASTASMLTAHFLAVDAIAFGDSGTVAQRYLPGAADGALLGAFALTEPDAGSNPADMRCTATRTDGGYRIKGQKHFISNAAEADFAVVFAVTEANKLDVPAHRRISAFVVDLDSAGVRASRPEPTMGLRGGHIAELDFDCVVGEEARLGQEGSGFAMAMRTLDNGRLEVAAMCHGIAQAALDASTHWMRERRIGGRTLGDYQGVQWMLADMATDLAASRALLSQTNRERAAGERISMAAAQVKLFATEMAGRVTDSALQIHGGYGYTSAMPLERYVRDVRIMRIYEGASEVQRNIIARNLLKAD